MFWLQDRRKPDSDTHRLIGGETMNYSKKDIPVHDLETITKAIEAAKVVAEFDPVLFAFPEPNDMPSKAQVAFTKEILDDWLDNDTLTFGYERFISEALSFMHFSLESLADFLSDDKQANIDYILKEYGIEWDEEFACTLLKYSKIYMDQDKKLD